MVWCPGREIGLFLWRQNLSPSIICHWRKEQTQRCSNWGRTPHPTLVRQPTPVWRSHSISPLEPDNEPSSMVIRGEGRLNKSPWECFLVYIQSTSENISIAVTLANVFYANFNIFQWRSLHPNQWSDSFHLPHGTPCLVVAYLVHAAESVSKLLLHIWRVCGLCILMGC